MISGLTICLNRNTGNFVVVNNCLSPKFGCSTEWGPLIHMTPQQFETDGFAYVLQSLQEYPTRQKTEKSELESLSRDEQTKFDRDHRHVSLSLQEGNELWLAPMHYGKRGGRIGGDMSETQRVPLPSTPEVFFHAIVKAFEMAD